MKIGGEIYYQFPAALMFGFWESEEQKICCLNNVLYYCAYNAWCTKGRGGRIEESEFHNLVCEELGLSQFEYDSKSSFYRSTRELRDKYDHDSYGVLKWRISNNMFFDYYTNTKTAEERAGLLVYLATRSILGSKPFTKTNKFFLTSRMACNLKNQNELPEEIEKYRLRYHFDKLKTMLFTAFNVAIFSDKATRGIFVSLRKNADGKPDLLWLAQQVEKIRSEKKENIDPLKVALQKVKSELQKTKDTYTAPNEQREQHLKNST